MFSIARLSYSKVAAIEVVTVEHANSEVVGIHAPWSANRFEALEPVRQGVHLCFGAMAPRVARGLKLRHDHGSNYMSLCAGGLMKYAPLAFHTRGRIFAMYTVQCWMQPDLKISGVASGDRMKPRTTDRAVVCPGREVEWPWTNMT